MYRKVVEDIPKDAPDHLENKNVTTTFLDANLILDVLTGRSGTAMLNFFNTTPGDSYSKRQATMENATCGSEYVAAKTATGTLESQSKSYMFGDNKSVVTSDTIPNSHFSKRHNIMSYHRVREAIAAKIISFYWCH